MIQDAENCRRDGQTTTYCGTFRLQSLIKMSKLTCPLSKQDVCEGVLIEKFFPKCFWFPGARAQQQNNFRDICECERKPSVS